MPAIRLSLDRVCKFCKKQQSLSRVHDPAAARYRAVVNWDRQGACDWVCQLCRHCQICGKPAVEKGDTREQS